MFGNVIKSLVKESELAVTELARARLEPLFSTYQVDARMSSRKKVCIPAESPTEYSAPSQASNLCCRCAYSSCTAARLAM